MYVPWKRSFHPKRRRRGLLGDNEGDNIVAVVISTFVVSVERWRLRLQAMKKGMKRTTTNTVEITSKYE
jgi:hypothetical protein